MKIIIEKNDFIKNIQETMYDSKIPDFFKRATGRNYTEKETCVNDIRRLLMLFWNDRLRIQNNLKEVKDDTRTS
jgi:hypothetical protein